MSVYMLTVEKLLSWSPRYARERIEKLFAGREALTPREVAESADTPDDALWVLLREEYLPERELRLLAADFAEIALLAERAAGREPHPDSWACLEVARRYARGEATGAERSAAWSAARSAAWSAAGSAARSAARSAAWSAAESAAESAAWSAAESAAGSAQLAKVLAAIAEEVQ